MKRARIFFPPLLALTFFLLFLPFVPGKLANSRLFYQLPESRDRLIGSPFESSGSSSRYALTEAIVERGSFFFDAAQTKFAAPDVASYQHRNFSVFSPGLSFIAVPFYIIGKTVNLAQLSVYLSTLFFAISSCLLIYYISRSVQTPAFAAFLGSLTFAVASSGFPYAFTLTQHHAATLLLLTALFLTITKKPSFIVSCVLGGIMGIAILIDVPNAILLLPVYFYYAVRVITTSKNLKLVGVQLLAICVFVIPFLLGYAMYNYELSGSYTRLPQVIGRSKEYEVNSQIDDVAPERESLLPYDTRLQLIGFYILLISDERGLVRYAPVTILGLLGLLVLYRQKDRQQLANLLLTSVLAIVLSYSMFGDPWGGWSFGPRYLIPAQAVLTLLLSVAIGNYYKKPLFMAIFFALFAYSLTLNTVASATTTQVPTKHSAYFLSAEAPYTYIYNLDLARASSNSSLLYNSLFKQSISSTTYITGYVVTVLFLALTIYVPALLPKPQKGQTKRENTSHRTRFLLRLKRVFKINGCL